MTKKQVDPKGKAPSLIILEKETVYRKRIAAQKKEKTRPQGNEIKKGGHGPEKKGHIWRGEEKRKLGKAEKSNHKKGWSRRCRGKNPTGDGRAVVRFPGRYQKKDSHLPLREY